MRLPLTMSVINRNLLLYNSYASVLSTAWLQLPLSIVFTRFHQKKSCNSHHFILDFSFFLKKSRNFCISKSFLGNSPESKITAKLTLVDIIVLYTIILKTCLKVRSQLFENSKQNSWDDNQMTITYFILKYNTYTIWEHALKL